MLTKGKGPFDPTKIFQVGIVVKSVDETVKFYQEVFGCVPVPPERALSGAQLEAGTGLPGARIAGVHLRLPGCGESGPTLEIFEYGDAGTDSPRAVNRPGYAHLAFAVDSVPEARAQVLTGGGSAVGDVVTVTIPSAGRVTWCYVRDPEGNVVELQSWNEG